MNARRSISREVNVAGPDELFEMANLFPRTTGLPMTIWVGPRGNARYDVRIKVNLTHGNQMNIDNTAIVGIRPTPHVIAGPLSAADQRGVFNWITRNEATLIAYWDGSIDTAELIQRLTPIPPAA